jgi:hypothetical protein
MRTPASRCPEATTLSAAFVGGIPPLLWVALLAYRFARRASPSTPRHTESHPAARTSRPRLVARSDNSRSIRYGANVGWQRPGDRGGAFEPVRGVVRLPAPGPGFSTHTTCPNGYRRSGRHPLRSVCGSVGGQDHLPSPDAPCGQRPLTGPLWAHAIPAIGALLEQFEVVDDADHRPCIAGQHDHRRP